MCHGPLREFSRVPVCRDCLHEPAPLAAEYFCVSCRTPFLNRFPLDAEGRCALCRSGLWGFDAAWCYGAYEGKLRELIHLFKYGRIRTLARPLGDLLSNALPRDQRFDLVVPVPLHWRRRWRRGFNQSELLAREIARRCGLPVRRLVRRRRSTRTQAGLSNSARRENVAGAFSMYRAAGSQGRRILLVDDVMTTGATAGACAMVLKRAGARYVGLLTLARVDRRFRAPAGGAPVARRT
ncbi:MAG TPA: ComF family protein [Bryobacteraceae bacterium]|nr:ComF family protein [Bryobacteraceae bacterium]